MQRSGIVVMMIRQHGDRWGPYRDRHGVESLSSLLTPTQLGKINILPQFDEKLLQEISTDLSLARWPAAAVVFDDGSYLNTAFCVVEGEVEASVAGLELHSVASKCDLCHASAQGPACVSSCPRGAPTRISSAEESDALLEGKSLAGAPA